MSKRHFSQNTPRLGVTILTKGCWSIAIDSKADFFMAAADDADFVMREFDRGKSVLRWLDDCVNVLVRGLPGRVYRRHSSQVPSRYMANRVAMGLSNESDKSNTRWTTRVTC
jgi:hypothetical protein